MIKYSILLAILFFNSLCMYSYFSNIVEEQEFLSSGDDPINDLFNKIKTNSISNHEDEIIEMYNNNKSNSELNNLMGVLYVSRNINDKAVDYLRFEFIVEIIML